MWSKDTCEKVSLISGVITVSSLIILIISLTIIDSQPFSEKLARVMIIGLGFLIVCSLVAMIKAFFNYYEVD